MSKTKRRGLTLNPERYHKMLVGIARATRGRREWPKATIVGHRSAMLSQFALRYGLNRDKTFDDFRHVIAEEAERIGKGD